MHFDLLFRIFYSGFYAVLLLLLVVLLLITPGDGIRQALENNQLYNVFVIAGVYLLTVVFAVIIYAARLYTTRTTLAAIPKTWIPVEKGDVGKSVRKMIVEGLTRSAVIAWDAKPRIPLPETAVANETTRERNEREIIEKHTQHHLFHKKKNFTRDDFEKAVALPEHEPVWGIVSHNGWASPLSPDLPELEYVDVILELPHLIEAKAVSVLPMSPTEDEGVLLPDTRAVQLLQRSATATLRDYITRLAQLNVLAPVESVADFVTKYEHARFSACALSEADFRRLMHLFAEILRMVKALEPWLIDEMAPDEEGESYLEADRSGDTTPDAQSIRFGNSLGTARRVSRGTIHSLPSRQHSIVSNMSMVRNGSVMRKKSSRSLRSNSSASVIRLNADAAEDELPYTLQF